MNAGRISQPKYQGTKAKFVYLSGTATISAVIRIPKTKPPFNQNGILDFVIWISPLGYWRLGRRVAKFILPPRNYLSIRNFLMLGDC